MREEGEGEGTVKLDLVLEEYCEFSQYFPRNITCQNGMIIDYSGPQTVETGEKCERCSGTGSVLTDVGREVVELVRKWAPVLAAEEAEDK